ncbi:MAG: glutaredoxin family protein [Acidobacteria bacterium]|nr:glutaredoxin family protein [Acidobacteriota bacterium]
MVKPIVVFSGSHRLACEQVKEFLSRAGRVFTVRNVDEDDDAHRELMALNLRSVPVTVVGAGPPHRRGTRARRPHERARRERFSVTRSESRA